MSRSVSDSPQRGRLSIESDGPVLTWYCVEGHEVGTAVTLTNTSSIPLVVDTDPPPTKVSYNELSSGDYGEVRAAEGRVETFIPIGEKATLIYRTGDLPADITFTTRYRAISSSFAGFGFDVIAGPSKSSKLKKAGRAYSIAECAESGFKGVRECGGALASATGSRVFIVGMAAGYASSSAAGWTMNAIKGDSHLTVAYTPAQPETLPEQTSEGQPDSCAGIINCERVDRADVDGDGRLDAVALVGEPDEYPDEPNTQITVRVLLADGTTLTREAALEDWYGDTAWLGATDFGQVSGEELVVAGTSGPHTKWYRVLTYRDGELVELPYPESDPVRNDTFYATMWPIDAALSAYVGVQCDTVDSTVVLPSVTPPGIPSDSGIHK